MSRAYSPLHLRLILILVLTAALPLAACGGDDDDDGSAGGVDAAADGCVETDLLPADYRPIAMVSMGDVTATPAGGVTMAVIDARAGGMPAAPENPYIYVDLDAGAKVEIDDVDAFSSTAWDVAFKRSSIRVNSGDSGPGGVVVATVAAETLDDVTAAPAEGDFAADDWASDDCQFQGTDFGEPDGVFGQWYDYDFPTHHVDPKAAVQVFRTKSGNLVKLDILTYYGDETGTEAAVYGVAWAPL